MVPAGERWRKTGIEPLKICYQHIIVEIEFRSNFVVKLNNELRIIASVSYSFT